MWGLGTAMPTQHWAFGASGKEAGAGSHIPNVL
jgi:hypothetical protein